MIELSLDGTWMLREEPLHIGEGQYGHVASAKSGWIEASIPGDISSALIENGRIKEPTVALNSIESAWVEDRSWWLKKEFVTEADIAACDHVELILDGLDSIPLVFLNHQKIPLTASVFRPLIADVKQLLAPPGENNLLVVRITSGLEHFCKEDIAELEPYVNVEPSGNRGDKRRVFVRKPQDFFGVDWNPRIPTCGITGGAGIRGFSAGTIRNVYIRTSLADRQARLNIEVTVESFDWIGTCDGKVSVALESPQGERQEIEGQFLMKSGVNFCRLEMTVNNPKLWWPNGAGEQDLYLVSVKATLGGVMISHPTFTFGIRTVEVDLSKLEAGGRMFAFVINGRRIFCKGANWAPPDSLYARVTAEKYQRLLQLAKEANFNMLRICGGGMYERDSFYQLCDRMGILIWQDFMFCTAAYPDNLDWFINEIRAEARYQVTRLRLHPCIALWSGNNENHTGFDKWWRRETRRGSYLYNELLPDIVHHYCPDIPYWNGAPYGGSDPNSTDIGDTHYYLETDTKRIENLRLYDEIDFRFVSEFGHVGPCSASSTRRYLGGAIQRGTKEWLHHTDLSEKGTLEPIVEQMYTQKRRIDDNEFLFFGGLVQGVLYEYTIDSLRAKPHCSGALFWMYADCWGEIGWSIVDYYMVPKIAYHFVKRAFTSARLIMRKGSGTYCVVVVNDTDHAISGELDVGYNGFAENDEGERLRFSARPFGATIAAEFDDPGYDLTRGYVFARPVSGIDMSPAIYRELRTAQLPMQQPKITVRDFRHNSDGAELQLETDVYAHAVHFGWIEGLDPSVSDNYFDLLPGERKWVRITGAVESLDMVEIRSVGPSKIWRCR